MRDLPSKTVCPPPVWYKEVYPCILKDEKAGVPVIEQPQRSDKQVLTKALQQEYDWLEEVRSSIASDAYQGEIPIAWGGYHSKLHNV